MIGVRSQMSSVGKNVLNYYEGIVGECISLQDRFPMSTIGYAYLMPLRPIMEGRETEVIDHARFAKMYAAISGRSGQDYKNVRGIYDQFAYLVVDFDQHPTGDPRRHRRGVGARLRPPHRHVRRPHGGDVPEPPPLHGRLRLVLDLIRSLRSLHSVEAIVLRRASRARAACALPFLFARSRRGRLRRRGRPQAPACVNTATFRGRVGTRPRRRNSPRFASGSGCRRPPRRGRPPSR